jgi:hypothetical protein
MPTDLTLAQILNNSPLPIDIFWIDFEGELVMMGHVNRTKSTTFGSYEKHRFLVRLLPSSDTLDASSPREVIFSKSPFEEQIEVVWNETSHEVELYSTSPYDELHDSVASAVIECEHLLNTASTTAPPDPAAASTAFNACLVPHLSPYYTKLLSTQNHLTRYREKTVDRLRNYTCDDPLLETTEPLSTTRELIEGKEFQVDSHLLMEEAQIFAIYDFISESECEILKTSAGPRLERAMVSGDSGAVVSESRKAQQASYDLNTPDDPLW